MSLLIDYLALCWFRNNPANLHPSTAFMWKTVTFYLISGMIVEFLIADVEGILEVLLRTVMAFTAITSFLLVIKRWQYFRQLFIAIFVCENFIMILAIAAEVLDYVMVRAHYPYREYISILLAVLLVGWYLAIVSYILRQTFATKMSRSVISAFSYFVLTYGIPMMFMDM
jgi:predicted thioredoxin/glutaredoxin